MAQRDIWTYLLAQEDVSLASRNDDERIANAEQASWWEFYKDPMGQILFQIAMPDYSTYTDKIDHTDARIALLNLKAEVYSQNIPLDDIKHYVTTRSLELNPGYAGATLSWDEKDHEL